MSTSAATRFQIGDIAVSRVVETEHPEFDPTWFFPDCEWPLLDPYMDWLQPRFIDPATKQLIIAVQSYVVRTPRHTVLIDSCVGEHKERRFSADWNMREGTDYLDKLAAAGVAPEAIDFVLCTHLHPDHVGWNTRRENGLWVPTFPNAKYVFARDEFDFWQAKSAKDPRKYDDGAFADSVLPVVEAGRHVVVDQDHALDDQVWLEPTPGHTPGHVAIRLSSNGAEAVMTGDLIHSILQCVFPDWCSRACFDKDQARATRRAFLDRYCETDTAVMTAHFPSPSVGRVTAAGDGYRFAYSPNN